MTILTSLLELSPIVQVRIWRRFWVKALSTVDVPKPLCLNQAEKLVPALDDDERRWCPREEFAPYPGVDEGPSLDTFDQRLNLEECFFEVHP